MNRTARAAPAVTRRTLLVGAGAAGASAAGGALAACGAGGATPQQGSKTLAPATIRFTPANGPGTDVSSFEPLLPQYMAERPNVRVELEVIPDGGWAKIDTLLTADTAADVTRINDDSVYGWGTGGKLTHLDPLIAKSLKKDDYFPVEWQATAVDGKLYSMQPHFGVNLFVYSQTLFERAGVSAPTDWKQTWSWDTFVASMRRIAALGSSAPGAEVFGAYIGGAYMMPMMWGNGVTPLNADETKCTFNAKEPLEMLTELEALIHTHRLVTTSDNVALFQATRLGMNFGDAQFGTRMPPEVRWDLMPPPRSKKAAYQEGFVRTFSLPKATKELDAAWDFMTWLMQSQAQIHLGRAGYGVPGLKAASDPTFKEGILKDKNWKLIPDGLNHDMPLTYNPLAQAFKAHYNTKAPDFFSGKAKAREWLDEGCLNVDTRIRELGWKKKG